MTNTFVGSEVDRLPWLKDEVQRRKKSPSWVVAFVAASAVAIIAALSFWLGMNGAFRSLAGPQSEPQTSIELPPAASEPALLESGPMPEVDPSITPTVELPVQKDVNFEAPPVRRMAAGRAAAHQQHRVAKVTAKSKKAPAEDTEALKYASPWKSNGVSGRMVRVGAYSSLGKGKD